MYAFLIDLALALVTLAGTAGLLWVWFLWLAGKAPHLPVPPPRRVRARRPTPSAAQAEIAELERWWQLPARRTR